MLELALIAALDLWLFASAAIFVVFLDMALTPCERCPAGVRVLFLTVAYVALMGVIVSSNTLMEIMV